MVVCLFIQDIIHQMFVFAIDQPVCVEVGLTVLATIAPPLARASTVQYIEH